MSYPTRAEGLINLVIRCLKRFCSGCKDFDNQARSGRSKSEDSKATFHATEGNPAVSTRRVLGGLGILPSSVVYGALENLDCLFSFVGFLVCCCSWLSVVGFVYLTPSVLFLTSFNLLASSLSGEGCKEIKEGKKKTKIHFNSKLHNWV